MSGYPLGSLDRLELDILGRAREKRALRLERRLTQPTAWEATVDAINRAGWQSDYAYDATDLEPAVLRNEPVVWPEEEETL